MDSGIPEPLIISRLLMNWLIEHVGGERINSQGWLGSVRLQE